MIMDIETCKNCQKQFRLIRNEMSYPVCKEVETYYCPHCHQEYKRSIRGTFSTERIEIEPEVE